MKSVQWEQVSHADGQTRRRTLLKMDNSGIISESGLIHVVEDRNQLVLLQRR